MRVWYLAGTTTAVHTSLYEKIRHFATAESVPATHMNSSIVIDYSSSDLSVAPVCASRKYRQYYGGNRRYCSSHCRYWLCPPVPSDVTRAIAPSRRYATGAMEGSLPNMLNGSLPSFDIQRKCGLQSSRLSSSG